MEIASYIVIALVAYLLGSIPTGYLVAKAKGIDIRTVGSGNIGATNAFRVLGKPAGFFVLFMDALKGWLAVKTIAPLVSNTMNCPLCEGMQMLAGVSAILGHNYTCWLKFKGGKGVATTGGVFIALAPWAFLWAIGSWVFVFLTSRYVSLASIAAAVVLPTAVWIMRGYSTLSIITIILGALAIYKHKANIQRLLDGTENRFGKKKTEAAK